MLTSIGQSANLRNERWRLCVDVDVPQCVDGDAMPSMAQLLLLPQVLAGLSYASRLRPFQDGNGNSCTGRVRYYVWCPRELLLPAFPAGQSPHTGK